MPRPNFRGEAGVEGAESDTMHTVASSRNTKEKVGWSLFEFVDVDPIPLLTTHDPTPLARFCLQSS